MTMSGEPSRPYLLLVHPDLRAVASDDALVAKAKEQTHWSFEWHVTEVRESRHLASQFEMYLVADIEAMPVTVAF